jgi:hypothetical protein
MITVHVFSDRLHRYAFTKDNKGNNLPVVENSKTKWKYIESRTYQLNDKKFPLLPITSNQINNGVNLNGFYIIDLLEQSIT